MRLAVLVVLAALALPGCATDDATPQDPLFGLCPQWQDGPGQVVGAAALNASARQASEIVGPTSMTLDGHGFDMVRVRIDVMQVRGGSLHLRAFSTQANGTEGRLAWRDFRPQVPTIVPELVFDGSLNETAHVYEAYLTSITQAEAQRPAPVELRWSLEGNGSAAVQYTITYHYRVCGADV
ncbi:MAG: hypothetical protein V4510_05785 [bacterium]